jgi:hypothetical protein
MGTSSQWTEQHCKANQKIALLFPLFYLPFLLLYIFFSKDEK